MAYLVLVRHGQSEWNALGLWTGFSDVELSEKGRQEAQKAAELLKDIPLHKAHTSALKRAQQTLEEITKALELSDIPVNIHAALNERDYGEMTGKNKWEIKEKHGEEQFNKWRRGWDEKIPGGETLKDVHSRVVPYFEDNILMDLKDGKNIIVAAHGNSLRALVKHLENIADSEVPNLELGTGEIYVYEIDENGKVLSKEIRGKNLAP
jgi:2,3-bisphosphoglycerate-dependent phosphoglycerate mutase